MRRTLSLLISLAVLSQCGGSKEQSSTRPVGDSLYEQFGSLPVLAPVVDSWILAASTDPKIRERFALSDVPGLKTHLLARLCLLLDGPCVYEGRELHSVHAEMKLAKSELDAFIGHLETAMTDAEVPEEVREETMRRLRQLALESALIMGGDVP